MFQKLYNKAISAPIATIVLCAIILRLIVTLLYQHITIFPDSEGYIVLAQYISNLDLNGYDGLRNPGYPALIAMAGNSLWLTVSLQMLFGLITATYFYKTLLVLQFRKVAALMLTVILNSLLHVVFYETAILTENFTLLIITLVFYLFFRNFLVSATIKNVVLLGIMLGLLVLVKSFYIFMPFLLYGLYVLNDFRISNIINKRLALFILPILAYTGWSYVNKVNTGYYTSTSLHGIYLSQNCVYFAENVPPKYKLISDIYVKHRQLAITQNKDVAMSIWYAYDELLQKTGMNMPQLSNELAAFSKDAIRMNPGAYAKQVITLSWRDFWKVDMYWNYHDFKVPYANKALIAVWYIQWAIIQLLKILFLLLIPYNVWLYLSKKKLTPAIMITLVVFAVSILQALVTYGTNSRFSFPFEFLIIASVLLTLGTIFKKLNLLEAQPQP